VSTLDVRVNVVTSKAEVPVKAVAPARALIANTTVRASGGFLVIAVFAFFNAFN